jgi:membrane-associated phospholipid phosphatase
LGVLYVLLMAWARVATGQHSFTDVLGGISVGVAVTLATVLVLTAWRQGNPQRGY